MDPFPLKLEHTSRVQHKIEVIGEVAYGQHILYSIGRTGVLNFGELSNDGYMSNYCGEMKGFPVWARFIWYLFRN